MCGLWEACYVKEVVPPRGWCPFSAWILQCLQQPPLCHSPENGKDQRWCVWIRISLLKIHTLLPWKLQHSLCGICQALRKTRRPLGPGQGPDKMRNAKFINPHDSATCPHIPERFLSLSVSPGTPPGVSAPSGESEFSASRFWSRANFGYGNELRDAFGRLSALSCGHRRGIPPVFGASASSANDPGGFRIADSFANVWGTFQKARGQCWIH